MGILEFFNKVFGVSVPDHLADENNWGAEFYVDNVANELNVEEEKENE